MDRAGLILLLLANGVKIDVKTTDEGLSSFMIACIMGDVQLAELLLARGASIHNTDKESKLSYSSGSIFSIFFSFRRAGRNTWIEMLALIACLECSMQFNVKHLSGHCLLSLKA